ncbi:MAG: hypothetical protein A2912_03760 [Candidatus Buchananbacteria bacterium RIFCSPLOWO2_01_FULL_40_23b]|uniref:Uncharacterized protein n=1 Tax=Candidatus Buchananbacteria bacterium RIFCSPLOWO2_01_FULL_40_23b TaxID=1797544 RepID=A0A1G1YMQ1_9BACT|nr:MAG: hypothetical protein A2912_03760 [Candidatus Buchananbacteria bacterium RIFCSPLOWO2_01_FULL_40_23b]
MADIRRLSWLMSRERTIEDVASGDISLVVKALVDEQAMRPKLVQELGRFPRVLVEYIGASEYTKERLGKFHARSESYFSGGSYGDCIKYFSKRKDKGAELLARKCRYATQLVKLFDFYMEKGIGKRFTQSYMVYDTDARKDDSIHRMGMQLVRGVRKRYDISMEDIVGIVADVRPAIREYYCSPEQQYQRRGNVAFLDFGKK